MIRKKAAGSGFLLAISLMMTAPSFAQLEKLLMPGKLHSAHAQLEDDCGNCHERSGDMPQKALCVTCHETVASDISQETGFHGRLDLASSANCVACHTDHEGRDADILGLQSGAFDHEFTDFRLHGAHFGVDCQSCHKPNKKFRDASSSCIDCHAKDDFHNNAFGSQCGLCHNDTTWTRIVFDHAKTDYPLTGQHGEVACADCHQQPDFHKTPKQCSTCHGIDDIHGGNNGSQCQQCHTTSGWSQLKFDHLAKTGFALTAGHSGLVCQDCHTSVDFDDDLKSTCVSCHQGDDEHQGRNGTECGDCHTATQWDDGEFDHTETSFPLHGKHDGLMCSACHKQEVDVPLSAVCQDCHKSEDVHGGQLGDQCGDCHGSESWTSDVVFEHDLTSFPLTGLHATVVCEACHNSQQFRDTAKDCATCHAKNDPHQGRLGSQCQTCHNTNAWGAWTFDHDLQTNFRLEESHKGLQCIACHVDPSKPPSNASSTCATCHKSDDVHDGEFGQACGRCHNTRTFSEIERL